MNCIVCTAAAALCQGKSMHVHFSILVTAQCEMIDMIVTYIHVFALVYVTDYRIKALKSYHGMELTYWKRMLENLGVDVLGG